MAEKITDVFKTGDKVEWVTIHHRGGTIEIKKHEGVIEAIKGSKALIKSPGFQRRRWVSLFELKAVAQ